MILTIRSNDFTEKNHIMNAEHENVIRILNKEGFFYDIERQSFNGIGHTFPIVLTDKRIAAFYDRKNNFGFWMMYQDLLCLAFVIKMCNCLDFEINYIAGTMHPADAVSGMVSGIKSAGYEIHITPKFL